MEKKQTVQEVVLAAMKVNEYTSTSSIARTTGLPTDIVRYALKRLFNAGKVMKHQISAASTMWFRPEVVTTGQSTQVDGITVPVAVTDPPSEA